MRISESVFSRLFSYRPRENISPLENYLIELFAFCLESDKNFKDSFFEKCLKIPSNSKKIKVKTQVQYLKYGRPDIEIYSDETIIIIECKVNSQERKDQLNDYQKIINIHHPEKTSKHLVYLTKFFENREINDMVINFHLLRWFSICEIINDTNTEVTQELKKFLINQGMEKTKNFTIQDLLAMKTIPETMTKMDELLELFKIEFNKEFGGYSTSSSRSTRFYFRTYNNYVQLNFNNVNYLLHIGFFWWWDDIELPYIGLSIVMPSKQFKNSDLFEILNEKLIKEQSWEFEDDESSLYVSSYRPITDFISSEDNNFEMQKFLQNQLNILYDLRKQDNRLFKK